MLRYPDGWGPFRGVGKNIAQHLQSSLEDLKFKIGVGQEMGYQSSVRDLQKVEFTVQPEQSLNRNTSIRIKRATDILIASIALIFLLPVLIPIALIIKLSDGGPVFFKQNRIGRNGKEFALYKFRSMVVDSQERLEELLENDPKARAEWAATQKLVNDPRITPFGHFLRKSSLDELPQIWSILRGEMSVVGPRPIVRNEIEKYDGYFDLYCETRPGLTGLWQVSGRSDTSYETRVALDAKYVTERTFSMDMKILLLTIPAVLRRSGAV